MSKSITFAVSLVALSAVVTTAAAEDEAGRLGRQRYEQGFRTLVHAESDLDRQVGVSLVLSGARKGHIPAYTLLATLMTQGNFLPNDSEIAVSLFEKAAAAGDATAMNNLARLYAEGENLPVDLPKAERLAADASAQGVTSARDMISAIETTTAAPPPVVEAPAKAVKKVVVPAKTAKPATKVASTHGGYFVQLSAVDGDPQSEWKRLLRLHREALQHYTPFYQAVDRTENGKGFTRILLGPVSTGEDAKETCRRLTAKGIRGCVIRPR